MKRLRSVLKSSLLGTLALLGFGITNPAQAALMFSYQEDLSEAQVVDQSTIDARTVYFFDDANYQSVTIECCDWLSGPGSRLQGDIEAATVYPGESLKVDLSNRQHGAVLSAVSVLDDTVTESTFTISRDSGLARARLSKSGPVVAKRNGQVIQNLRIDAGWSSRCAINVKNLKNVTIRNVYITHKNIGICAKRTSNLKIQNVKVVSTSAPSSGPHCKKGVKNCFRNRSRQASPNSRLNIRLHDADKTLVEHAQFELGSTGVSIYSSNSVRLFDIRCLDIRGPAPRGNCAQFGNSKKGYIKNFYAKNIKNKSGEHDVISFFNSDYGTVSHGLIDGVYSINGVGVISDRGSDYLTISNVDFLNTTNSAVSISTSRGNNTVGHRLQARNIRVKNTHCKTRFGIPPSSGGLILTVHPASDYPEISNYQYWNHCRKYIVHCLNKSCRSRNGGQGGKFDIRKKNFTPRSPLKLRFSWE